MMFGLCIYGLTPAMINGPTLAKVLKMHPGQRSPIQIAMEQHVGKDWFKVAEPK